MLHHPYTRHVPFPEAIIAGAKKSGTSLIMHLLQHNPMVFMLPYEPHYFDNPHKCRQS